MAEPYVYVHKIKGRYVLTVGKEEAPPKAKRGDRRFDTLDTAMEVACDNDDGYAVRCAPDVDAELKAIGR